MSREEKEKDSEVLMSFLFGEQPGYQIAEPAQGPGLNFGGAVVEAEVADFSSVLPKGVRVEGK